MCYMLVLGHCDIHLDAQILGKHNLTENPSIYSVFLEFSPFLWLFWSQSDIVGKFTVKFEISEHVSFVLKGWHTSL